MEHDLKCWPNFYDAVKSGAKNFEVRRDDRGFQKGDILVLKKYEPGRGYFPSETDSYKCEELRRRITYVLTGGQFGIEPGHVVMGLEPA